MSKKKTKEKIEYFCPHCKKVVGFNETVGETIALSAFKILKTQDGQFSRTHLNCGSLVVELRRKK